MGAFLLSNRRIFGAVLTCGAILMNIQLYWWVPRVPFFEFKYQLESIIAKNTGYVWAVWTGIAAPTMFFGMGITMLFGKGVKAAT
jgi:hypothetical protein